MLSKQSVTLKKLNLNRFSTDTNSYNMTCACMVGVHACCQKYFIVSISVFAYKIALHTPF